MVYKDKFPSPDEINETIQLIETMASEQGLVAALIGGIALQVYGSPRLTKDVDFAMDKALHPEKVLRKNKQISFGGTSYFSPGGIKVDLIVRNDEYRDLYEDALRTATESPHGIPIVDPEHLAAMKLAAAREHDILDLKWMIRRRKLLDVRKARAIVYRFMGRFAQDRFDDIVDQAHVEKEMMRRRGRNPEEE